MVDIEAMWLLGRKPDPTVRRFLDLVRLVCLGAEPAGRLYNGFLITLDPESIQLFPININSIPHEHENNMKRR